jgi:hypothetical protein
VHARNPSAARQTRNSHPFKIAIRPIPDPCTNAAFRG